MTCRWDGGLGDEGARERWDEGTMGRGRDGANGYPVRFACGTVREMNLAGVVERRRDEGTRERGGEWISCKVCVRDCA